MKCPHCNEKTKIPDVVFLNAENYHNTNLTVTNCCGKMVYVSPHITFKIHPYFGKKTEDDWGIKSR